MIQAMRRKVMFQLLDEVEDTLLCIMAAGIPASHINLSEPEAVLNGTRYELIVNFSFKPGYAF